MTSAIAVTSGLMELSPVARKRCLFGAALAPEELVFSHGAMEGHCCTSCCSSMPESVSDTSSFDSEVMHCHAEGILLLGEEIERPLTPKNIRVRRIPPSAARPAHALLKVMRIHTSPRPAGRFSAMRHCLTTMARATPGPVPRSRKPAPITMKLMLKSNYSKPKSEDGHADGRLSW